MLLWQLIVLPSPLSQLHQHPLQWKKMRLIRKSRSLKSLHASHWVTIWRKLCTDRDLNHKQMYWMVCVSSQSCGSSSVTPTSSHWALLVIRLKSWQSTPNSSSSPQSLQDSSLLTLSSSWAHSWPAISSYGSTLPSSDSWILWKFYSFTSSATTDLLLSWLSQCTSQPSWSIQWHQALHVNSSTTSILSSARSMDGLISCTLITTILTRQPASGGLGI